MICILHWGKSRPILLSTCPGLGYESYHVRSDRRSSVDYEGGDHGAHFHQEADGGPCKLGEEEDQGPLHTTGLRSFVLRPVDIVPARTRDLAKQLGPNFEEIDNDTLGSQNE